MEKIVLLDGYNLIFRAFYGVPMLNSADGSPTNALFGFANILFHILDTEKPDYLAVAFDEQAPTFRHKLFDAYKGTRKPMPEELKVQVPKVRELLTAFGICCVSLPGFEADDLLGTIAHRMAEEGLLVSVVSGDRDLLQILRPGVKILMPKPGRGKTETKVYDEAALLEEYHVTPAGFIDLKALMGDTSDNIPGLPGVGEKTAIKLLTEHGTLEGCYEARDSFTPKLKKTFTESMDLARLSKTLATIKLDTPVAFTKEEARLSDIYTKEAYALVSRYQFKSMMKRFPESVRGEATDLSQENPFAKNEKKPEVMDTAAVKTETDTIVYPPVIPPVNCRFTPGVRCELSELSPAVDSLPADQPVGVYLLSEGCALAIATADACRIFWAGEEEIPQLKEALKKLLSGKCSYVSDLSALYRFCGEEALALLPFKGMDLSLAAYLLNPLRSAFSYADLSQIYLGQSLPDEEAVCEKGSRAMMTALQDPVLDRILAYGAETMRFAGPVLQNALEQAGMLSLYRDLELPLSGMLYAMEHRGILVNKEELAAYGSALDEKLKSAEQDIYETAGERFNILSPKQLGEILFEKLGLPGGKKNKSGYSTAAEELEKIADQHPVVRKVIDYRLLAKLKSTYADGLASFIREDGRIHGHFNQTATATGRLSSTEPNLQNIPIRMELGKALRGVFIPKEGCVFVDADYSQIELRILAHMSGDEELLEAYRSAKDIHAATASKVFHVPLSEVTPELRRNAKAVNFGIVYGISAFGLSEDLHISQKEAKAYIEQYFATYPGIKRYLDSSVAMGKEKGYVKTLYDRIRPVPELSAPTHMQREFGKRIAMNSPIQGTAADIMKKAMLAVERGLTEAGLSAKVLLQIHDELLIECPVAEEEQVKNLVKSIMEQTVSLLVPLVAEVLSGKTWLEAH